MNKPLPKVAAIHDLSGYGRCSLTTAIPILSAMKIQVCPLPTAVLSSHSDGLGDFSFLDFTPYMEDYINHWKCLGLEFEGIYTGFLGSYEQIEIVSKFMDCFKNKDQLVVVDPVMGDQGVLYKTYTEEMAKAMTRLVHKAHVITPNLTEACFLLDKPYHTGSYTIEEGKQLLLDLVALGPHQVIITGLPIEGSVPINIGYDGLKNKFYKVAIDYVPEVYPGTGDMYASVLTGALINGDSLEIAMDKATSFVQRGAHKTHRVGSFNKEGVAFESIVGSFFTETFEHSVEPLE